MAITGRYVELQNPDFLKNQSRKISHLILQMINQTNFYNEAVDEEEEVVSIAREKSKNIRREFNSLKKYVERDQPEKEDNQIKKDKPISKAVKSKPKKLSPQRKLDKNLDEQKEQNEKEKDEALENLKENLKKLRQQLNN